MYHYESVMPMDQEGGQSGRLDAAKAHETLTKLSGPRSLEKGAADPRLLARMAALGLGVTVGLWASDRDHKWTGAAIGALVGLAAGRSPSALVAGWKKLWAADTRFRIDNLTNAWEYSQDRVCDTSLG
jgi:hypothetical protein